MTVLTARAVNHRQKDSDDKHDDDDDDRPHDAHAGVATAAEMSHNHHSTSSTGSLEIRHTELLGLTVQCVGTNPVMLAWQHG